jgi:hypothetical protein
MKRPAAVSGNLTGDSLMLGLRGDLPLRLLPILRRDMVLVLLVIVIGVFNICIGFALGVYVQSMRQASPNTPGFEDNLSLDDGFSPYRPLVSNSESGVTAAATADKAQP